MHFLAASGIPVTLAAASSTFPFPKLITGPQSFVTPIEQAAPPTACAASEALFATACAASVRKFILLLLQCDLTAPLIAPSTFLTIASTWAGEASAATPAEFS